eukprot:15444606-Alexandrium_andersonii.AAC.1
MLWACCHRQRPVGLELLAVLVRGTGKCEWRSARGTREELFAESHGGQQLGTGCSAAGLP